MCYFSFIQSPESAGKHTMGLTKLALIFGLVAIAGCGGGTSTTGTTPPPITPPAPSGPASGTELLYQASFGSIQVSTLNPQTGALTAPIDPLPIEFLPENGGLPPIASPSGKFLYIQAFDEFDGHTVGGKEAIYCYSITGSHGELTDIPGVIGPPFVPQYPPRISHPYAMVMDPKGRNLYLATDDDDVGNDSDPFPHSIRQYSIDPESGALTEQLPFSNTSAADSDDLAMDPAGKYLYAESVLLHSGIGISVFAIDSATGAIKEVSGSPFVANATISSNDAGNPKIFISPSGKYLYLNLIDQVYAFSIAPDTGGLTALPGSPYNLNFPSLQTLLMHPNGNFFYVTGMPIAGGNMTITSFPVDTNTGVITTTSRSVAETSDDRFYGTTLIDPAGKVLLFNSSDAAVSTFLTDGETGSIGKQSATPYNVLSSWQSATVVKIP